MIRITVTLLLMCFASDTFSQIKNSGFSFMDKIGEKRIDILFNDSLLTSYQYADSIMKPVLFPIKTRSGITVTRGFPMAPRAGERVDHPHHIGLWLNYESVNGVDFWNLSTAIPFSKRSQYGRIAHDGIVTTRPGKDKAELSVTARWVNDHGKILLRENTTYTFRIIGKDFIIDRFTTLNAMDEDVMFKDVKDGLLGLRVARELELPSDEAVTYIDNKGVATKVEAVNKEGVSGNYVSSNGLTGNDVWGTRGSWVSLLGKIKNDSISITIIDHPKNLGYPTYWHARGYGLFAANPLGQAVFSKGKEALNLELKKQQAVTFRYRVVIHEGSKMKVRDIEQLAAMFE